MFCAAKSVLGDLLSSEFTMKTTTFNRQTTPHISYIHIHTLGYKIKSLTVLKQNKLHKTNLCKTRRQLCVIAIAAGYV